MRAFAVALLLVAPLLSGCVLLDRLDELQAAKGGNSLALSRGAPVNPDACVTGDAGETTGPGDNLTLHVTVDNVPAAAAHANGTVNASGEIKMFDPTGFWTAGGPFRIDAKAPAAGAPLCFTLPFAVPRFAEDGLYTVQVAGKAGGRLFFVEARLIVEGGYTHVAEREPDSAPDAALALVADTAVSGRAGPGDVDHYRIEPGARRVAVEVPGNEGAVRVEVLDAQGRVLANATATFWGRAAVLTLPDGAAALRLTASVETPYLIGPLRAA